MITVNEQENARTPHFARINDAFASIPYRDYALLVPFAVAAWVLLAVDMTYVAGVLSGMVLATFVAAFEGCIQ